MIQQMPPAFYNSQKPLSIFDGENNRLDVHLSVSFEFLLLLSFVSRA